MAISDDIQLLANKDSDFDLTETSVREWVKQVATCQHQISTRIVARYTRLR